MQEKKRYQSPVSIRRPYKCLFSTFKLNVEFPVTFFQFTMKQLFHNSFFARCSQTQSVTCSISQKPFLPSMFDKRKRGEGFRLKLDIVVGSSDCGKTLKLYQNNNNKKCVLNCVVVFKIIIFLQISTFQICGPKIITWVVDGKLNIKIEGLTADKFNTLFKKCNFPLLTLQLGRI